MSDSLEKQNTPVDPRIHFAAERTLLAWIRTGLAMMGFIVALFLAVLGLFTAAYLVLGLGTAVGK